MDLCGEEFCQLGMLQTCCASRARLSGLPLAYYGGWHYLWGCATSGCMRYISLRFKTRGVACWLCWGAVGMYLRGVFVWWSASSACLVCSRTDEGALGARAARGAKYV